MNIIEHARKIRPVIEQAAQSLPDNDALTAVVLHPYWAENTAYTVGYKVQHGGKLYRCVQAHTALLGWEPDKTAALWAKVLIPDESAIPAWEQPDSTNPYMTGDKVTHNDKTWVSSIDNNVWEPGVYGWTEVI